MNPTDHLAERIARVRARGLDPRRTVIEPLASHHDRAAFSCGDPSLDDYIKTKATQDVKRQLTRCFVLTPEAGNGRVIGYYTLNAHTIGLDELDEASRHKLRAYAVLPAVLVGRLAVDSTFQGAQLASLLMLHALRSCLELSFQIGSMSVVVDVLDETVIGFYTKLGFTPIGSNPLRLHLPMGTVAKRFSKQAAALREKWGTPSNPFDVITAERE